jgi:DNA-binding NarL/FixJ family response regulator
MSSYYYPLAAEGRIRVLCAEPQTIVRQGVKSLLDREEGIEVVAHTGDGESLLELAREGLPDVIVSEVHLPLLGGIEATRRVVSEGLPCQVLFLTGNSDRESVVNAFDCGVRGYLLKEADFSCLTAGIRAVHARETYLGPGVSEILVGNPRRSAPEVQRGSVACLTAREQEILRLLAEGNSSKDIAFQLGISNKTVDTFRRRCMNKLHLKSSADLFRFALRQGMVRL